MHEHFEELHQRFHDRHGEFHGQLPSIEDLKRHRLQLMVVIVDRAKSRKVTETLQARHIHFLFSCLAQGTATSEIMDLLGLGSPDKSLILCIAPKSLMPELMRTVSEQLTLKSAGKGIAFTVPLSGVSSPIWHLMDKDMRRNVANEFEKEVEKMSTGASHDLILALINQGCSEDLMAAAKTAGATGGTVIHARRIGAEESMKFFGIAIQAEKEIVAILTSREKKKDIMQAIGRSCGMRSESKGIFLSVPVDSISGMVPDEDVHPEA